MRVFWCQKCQAQTGALVIETRAVCPDCRNPVDWKEIGYVLTKDDRDFLRENRIRAD